MADDDSGYGPAPVLHDATGACVTWVDAGPEQADAEFIVRACNHHEALLAACKMARRAATLLSPTEEKVIDTAIAKAEAQP